MVISMPDNVYNGDQIWGNVEYGGSRENLGKTEFIKLCDHEKVLREIVNSKEKPTRIIHLKVVDRFDDGTTREVVDIGMLEEMMLSPDKERFLWNAFVRLSQRLDTHRRV